MLVLSASPQELSQCISECLVSAFQSKMQPPDFRYHIEKLSIVEILKSYFAVSN